MERKTFVIYHRDCPDGFGAAYAAWLKFGDHATYVPAKYGDQPPEMDPDSLVYVLDFSYPRETVAQLGKQHMLTLLDHHKTAENSLGGLPGCLVDLSKSGATLAWQHFHPGQSMPLLIAYVQDRDLWKWELSNSRAISSYIYSKGYDFSTWREMHTILDSNPQRPVEIGQAIMQVQSYQLEALIANASIKTIAGYRVPTVYAPIMQSEIGERLLQLHPDAPFAGIYYERDDGRKWSLRSRADFDVSKLAESMGGGGHPQAAGFTEPPMSQQPQRN